MPPKSQRAAKAADKAKAAKNQKVAEDKTFGLKNKNKSTKVQTYVNQVQAQTKNDNRKNAAPVEDKKEKRRLEEQRQKELNELFAQAIKQPKVPVGVDPKSMLCEYFKAGQCTKGFKCKFSHDLNIGRKTQKIDLFADKREGGEEDGMEDWDQDKLEEVVKEKHGAEKSAHTKTDIICKFFLEAVEKKQYGWFWQCPNGGKDCKYRHALPPGYVLKSQMKELLEAEMENKKSIEEEIEEDRRKVEARTPITLQVFMNWRSGQRDKRAQDLAGVEAERRRKGNLTGREIFAEEGFLAEDDMGARDDTDYQQHEEGDEFHSARDLSDFARLHQQAAASTAAGPSSSGQNGASHEAGSSDSQPGPSNANGTTHVSEADAHLFLDDEDEDDDDSEEEDHGTEDSDSSDAD